MATISVYIQINYRNANGSYEAAAPYWPQGGFIETDMTYSQYKEWFEAQGIGKQKDRFFDFPKDDYIRPPKAGYEYVRNGNEPFYYAYPSDDSDRSDFEPRVIYPRLDWSSFQNGKLYISLYAAPTYDYLVKFGTLSNMFAAYKGLSDEALDKKLASLNVGGGGYTLPAATTTTLGGVKAGSNVTIASDGTISVAAPYALPKASASTLGGVKVGDGLSVASDGTLSATAQGGGDATPRDFFYRVIRITVGGVPCMRFFVKALSGSALTASDYGKTWKVAYLYAGTLEDFTSEVELTPSTGSNAFVTIKASALEDKMDGYYVYDNLVVARLIEGEWVVTGTYSNNWDGTLGKPFETVADGLVTDGMLDLAGLRTQIAQCVNGIVLYDNTSLSNTVYDITIDGVNAEEYTRFELLLTDFGRTGALGTRNWSTARVVFSLEHFDKMSSGNKLFCQAAVFQHNLNNYNEFYLSNAQMYISSTGSIEFYAEDNVRNFVLGAEGTNATAAIKPAGTYYVRIDKVIGYPKFPEVA